MHMERRIAGPGCVLTECANVVRMPANDAWVVRRTSSSWGGEEVLLRGQSWRWLGEPTAPTSLTDQCVGPLRRAVCHPVRQATAQSRLPPSTAGHCEGLAGAEAQGMGGRLCVAHGGVLTSQSVGRAWGALVARVNMLWVCSSACLTDSKHQGTLSSSPGEGASVMAQNRSMAAHHRHVRCVGCRAWSGVRCMFAVREPRNVQPAGPTARWDCCSSDAPRASSASAHGAVWEHTPG